MNLPALRTRPIVEKIEAPQETQQKSQTSRQAPTVERRPAVVSYVKGVTDKIGHILKRASIKTYFKPPKKVSQYLSSVKSGTPLLDAGVYKLDYCTMLRPDIVTPNCTTPTEPEYNLTIRQGCLNINPNTTRGRRIYVAQMLVLCFIPVAALVVQNFTIMTQYLESFDASVNLNSEVTEILTLGEAVMALQDERYVMTSLIITPHLDSIGDKPWKGWESYRRMAVYESIINASLQFLERRVKTISALWRQLAACLELLSAREKLSLADLDFQYLLTRAEPDPRVLGQFLRHLDAGLDRLQALIVSLRAQSVDFTEVQHVVEHYKTSNLLNESSKMADLKRTAAGYMKESKHCLDGLRRFQYGYRNVVRESAQEEVGRARSTLCVGVGILILELLISPALIMLVRNTMTTMQSFSASIAASTQRLMVGKQKSDLLLSRMLPMPVLQRLRAQRTVPAEAFDAVTIFFSDIVGFTAISANSTPMEVINMLNMLYRLFDDKIARYNVYKVETIGDAYMAVSGLPERNGNKHAAEIADMSLSLMRSLEGATVPHCPLDALKIRAGINTGPCVAGVVGTTMPRYCLFGDTINTASRMESMGEAMRIHISDTTKKALDMIGGYEVESRGVQDIPGKGDMETFWLLGKVGGLQEESPRGRSFKDYDQDVLELLVY